MLENKLIAPYHKVNVNLAKFITMMNLNDNNIFFLADKIIISNAFLFTHKAFQVIQLASEILLHTQNISFGYTRDEEIDF